MQRLIVVLAGLAMIGLGGFIQMTRPYPVIAAGDAALENGGDATRGRLVFFAGGCASCHATPSTPPGKEDPLRLGGGLAMPSPFGTFYAPNISPHPEHGIGKWTVANLANALIAGVVPNGSHYYPAFPYTSYARMRLSDVQDLMAFLRTLPADATPSKPHSVGFPFNIRLALGGWKQLFFDRSPLPETLGESDMVKRGRYLVEALGHCAECHSPRNVLGGIIASQRMAGGPDPHGKGWVSNISQHERALGKWSAKDIAGFLKTGLTSDGDVVGGSMAAVVKNMEQLPDSDLLAMGEYLKTLPALASPPRPK
ncbi:MAG: alkylated DNA repair protein [Alphaproteobacteria bacterium]|nr:alkylated DNA repair protein [Alphaproteobacteria bacterium]